MKFNANQNQKKVLSVLLDKYENSKTYKGENQVHQTFSIAPDIIMQEYDSDFADVEKIHRLEAELNELAEEQLVRLELKGTIIQKIFLIPESIPVC